MVLRKVPAGGSYFVGDNASHASIYHPKKTWTTDRDYYIGVFPVSQHQYTLFYGSNPSKPPLRVHEQTVQIKSTARTAASPART